MSNLGEGLAEEREAIGFAKGEASGFSKGEASGFSKGEASGFSKGEEKTMISVVLQMNKMRLPLDQMMSITGKSEQEIEDIIRKYGNKNN